MTSDKILTTCSGLLGFLVFLLLLFWFGWSTWKSDFNFQYGRVQGKLARAIGIIGILGTISGGYLVVSLLISYKNPFLATVTGLLFGIFIVVLFLVRFFSFFMRH